VTTPAEVIGGVRSKLTFPDNEMHYSAPGWRWN